MTDGPHRSLPLKRWWKIVAASAENRNYSREDVRSAIEEALRRDAGLLPIAKFVELIRGIDQLTLFSKIDQLAMIDAELAVFRESGLGRALQRQLKATVAGGHKAGVTHERIVSEALKDHALATVLSIEEHYLRKESQQSGRRIRKRLVAGLDDVNLTDVASCLLAPNSSRSRPALLKRRDGLDEGPQLLSIRIAT